MGEEGRPDSPGLRALTVLGNFALNGQECGNIEVFYATREVGMEGLFLIHPERRDIEKEAFAQAWKQEFEEAR